MGRYYDGDINGKFWFGVQSSTAADRFGVTGCAPGYLDYYFEKEDLKTVEDEIKVLEAKLGNSSTAFKEFFDKRDTYSDKTLEEANILELWNSNKSDYADLLLGIKIRDCIKEHGSCTFTAEV